MFRSNHPPIMVPSQRFGKTPPTTLYRVKKSAPRDKGEVRLYDGYEPQPFDVICKRDREGITHSGNNRFRYCVEMRVDRYLASKTRAEKSLIIQEIINAVHDSGGRFIRQQHFVSDNERIVSSSAFDPNVRQRNIIMPVYFDIGTKKAADKVGHAMRLAVSAREKTKGSRRMSWPCPSTVTSSPLNYDRRRICNSPDAKLGMDGDMESPRGVITPKIFSLDHPHIPPRLDEGSHSRVLKSKNPIRRTVFPALNATAMSRRQSWHAGCVAPQDKTLRQSVPSTPGNSVLIPSDLSLSSQEWDLSDFEDDDACTFGSILSLSECNHAIDTQEQPTRTTISRHELPQVIDITPVLASRAVRTLDDAYNGGNGEFPWDENLFDETIH